MCIFTIFFHKFLLYSLNLIMVWNILKYRASFYLVKMHLFDIKLTILYTFSNQRHLKILICVINHIWAQKFMRGPISIIGGKDRQINRWGEDLNYRPPCHLAILLGFCEKGGDGFFLFGEFHDLRSFERSSNAHNFIHIF